MITWAPAKVRHERLGSKTNKFAYNSCYMAIDLNNLENLNTVSPLISVDRFNYISFWQKDYLGWEKQNLKDKVIELCKVKDPQYSPGRLILLTMPRVLSYIFIPVSFYICFDANNNFRFLIAEINNTYSEKHVYTFDSVFARQQGKFWHWQTDKEFHVSPFYSNDYKYKVSLNFSNSHCQVAFNLSDQEKIVFTSDVHFELVQHDEMSLFNKYLTYPFLMIMAMPLIMWQALKLTILRRIQVIRKPNPSSPNTIRAEMYSWFDRWCYSFIKKKLACLVHGNLVLELPDGRKECFGSLNAQEQAHIKIHSYDTFRKILFKGSIGFGESYTSNLWSSNDLVRLLTLFLNNYQALAEERLNIFKPWRIFENLKYKLRRNSIKNSSTNIREHYDLSNDFFKLFLDKNMLYSSAYFKDSKSDLEQAQIDKLDLLASKAKLEPGHKVLEIGSGWGAFANRIAKLYGSQVTSLTLSKEQYEYAKKNAQAEGLKNLVDFQIKDYRNISGKYDRIVSIEMLEAVGAENLNTFFERCNAALNPNGVLAVQVIAYPDTHYERYVGRSDWINKHIFPGSHLPALGALLKSAADNGLVIEHVENLAEHYAETLKQWRIKFKKQSQQLEDMGFDQEFQRKWDFYLASCEAEFATRWLALYQIVFTRPNSKLSNYNQIYEQIKVA